MDDKKTDAEVITEKVRAFRAGEMDEGALWRWSWAYTSPPPVVAAVFAELGFQPWEGYPLKRVPPIMSS